MATNLTSKTERVRMIKFFLFSISAGVIQILSFTFFKEVAHFSDWLAYLIALILSVLWNFTLNRKFTFKSTANVPLAMFKVACYYAVFTPLTTLLEHQLTDNMGWNGYLVTIMNMAINLVTEFLYQRYVVYGKNVDTQPVKEKEKN